MTPKNEEEVYRGIHYIQISKLPADQQIIFKDWLPGDQIIKIMIGKKILADCVQYHHYEHWYETVFPIQLKEEDSDATDQVKEVETPNGNGTSSSTRPSFFRFFSLRTSS